MPDTPSETAVGTATGSAIPNSAGFNRTDLPDITAIMAMLWPEGSQAAQATSPPPAAPPSIFSSVPTWVWIAGGGLLALSLLSK